MVIIIQLKKNIPFVLQEAIDNSFYDQIISVSSEDGIAWAHKLAKKEGIITGISGGATFATALKVAEQCKEGSVILCMLPDTGERYLSSPLFSTIEEDMNEEENKISLSTPNYRMV